MESKPVKYSDRIEWRNEVGELHRPDGPAVEYFNGYRAWYQNGLLHRADGPAIKYSNGDKYWFQNGKCHRLNGPAVEWASKNKQYWINGIWYIPLFVEFDKIINRIKKHGK